jgi:hypothetical protein
MLRARAHTHTHTHTHIHTHTSHTSPPPRGQCYWDSLVMDFGLANLLGMIAGAATLKLFNCREFNWVGTGTNKVGAVLFSWVPSVSTYLDFSVANLEGKTWRDLDMKFFRSWTRLCNFFIMLTVGNLMEGNSFFFINGLNIPAAHCI